MNFAITLAGHRSVRTSFAWPARGLWSAHVELDEEVTLALGSSATLAIGEKLSLAGTIVRGGPFAGTSTYLVRAGHGGWNKTLPRRAYRSDGGVKASTVLTDAAREAGEAWAGALPTTPIGPAFARMKAPAIRVVNLLLGGAWYVDDDGRTQPQARPESTFIGEVLNVESASRMAKLASDTPENVRPRCTVPGVGRVSLVTIEAEHSRIAMRARGEV
jgi:hypothetical protein